jgi:hypothetical protein
VNGAKWSRLGACHGGQNGYKSAPSRWLRRLRSGTARRAEYWRTTPKVIRHPQTLLSAPILLAGPSKSCCGSSCVLANGGDFPGGASACGPGDAKAVWSDMAIRRTTPALLGLFSLVTLFAHYRMARSVEAVRWAAWYRKPRPTFSDDALALVRQQLWAQATLGWLLRDPDTGEVPRALVDHLTETLCYTG